VGHYAHGSLTKSVPEALGGPPGTYGERHGFVLTALVPDTDLLRGVTTLAILMPSRHADSLRIARNVIGDWIITKVCVGGEEDCLPARPRGLASG
jgi:hypothetical protein